MITIGEDTLPDIGRDEHKFRNFFCEYSYQVALDGARLWPVFSEARILDAYHFWTEDLARLRFSLSGSSTAPDHFKQAAHLAYWLRRTGPVVEFREADNIQDGGAGQLDSMHEAMRDLLFHFGSEYLAFDLGYHLCEFYETGRLPAGTVPKNFHLDQDYIRTICCFLKEKNVSPHALYLVYKSLFYKRFAD